ncbi:MULTISPECIES: DUF5606 domain-containing protein [unclassified Capnocytophaga]|jgi:hypothetical protein|uniref:DUF5606 family protein n=1 Tax=unclassified Capnocytophaga TaxID=2640652 RepID=UPI000202D6AA|nr:MULTISPECIES: DUF5606 domain-containing protein [unclassified Capnocytophaga]EGD33834.1 hypothetical protein HMPREF9071_1551 [Capnocytophaga sp. oral taxon 338 str. F0234]MEB3004955.1 DUF5606 domain-containing protein [Capnocytophaga sp. G2]
MKLNQILTISGKPGLYQLQSRTRSGFIALSLIDQKHISIGLRNNVSLLSEIAIYTLEGEKPLEEIFKAIKEKENGGKTAISHKATNDELEAYFFSVIPNYDEDKVYPSDIRKIIQWYNLLIDRGFLEDDPSEETKVEEEK